MISSKNKISWTDIENIYINLRKAQTNFHATLTEIPAKSKTKAFASDMSNLMKSIEDMSLYVGEAAIINEVPPNKGDIIKAVGISRAAATADAISRICNFVANSSCFGSCFTGFHNSDFSSFDSDFSFFDSDGSNFSGHDGSRFVNSSCFVPGFTPEPEPSHSGCFGFSFSFNTPDFAEFRDVFVGSGEEDIGCRG